MNDFEQYNSPFSWRYGSPEMRAIWSEAHLRRTWRGIWAALAEVQQGFGLVSAEQVAVIQAYVDEIDLQAAMRIEVEIQHDLMAELNLFAEQCGESGGVLHLGMTSMDVKDNADVLRMCEALDLVLAGLEDLLGLAADAIERWAETPVIAFTHLQPAEPTTLGYRLAQFGQDLLEDLELLQAVRLGLRGKGVRGAVGTGASFMELIGRENLVAFEKQFAEKLGLPFFPVVTQTYPRKQDYEVISALAGLGASLYKIAFDLRILQMPPVGEMAEPFGEKQVGSSAMPFKRNPVLSEKINSLARQLAQMPHLAWDNAAHSLLERTLDDSANRRTMLPEAFLITDEILAVTARILKDLRVDESAMARNMDLYGPFAATERVLMALGKAGADRQKMHERLRQHSLAAWDAIQAGKDNPLIDLVCRDKELLKVLDNDSLRGLMQAGDYVGDAPERARGMAERLRAALG